MLGIWFRAGREALEKSVVVLWRMLWDDPQERPGAVGQSVPGALSKASARKKRRRSVAFPRRRRANVRLR